MQQILRPLQLTRGFTSAVKNFRQWRLIETRKVTKQPDYKVGDIKPLHMPKERKEFPDYKYGESNIFKQSNKGLYGGSFVQFGNNISESKAKTRKKWLPNVIKKGLWSETLNRKISIKMTAKVLKTISREGGIDNYLTKEKAARIKELGPTGWKLRYRVLKRKDAIENYPHKDAPIIEMADGKKAKIYYNEVINGSPRKISVGRRKLMAFLYPLEKLEYRSIGKDLDHKKFVELFADVPVKDIVARLEDHEFDLSTITI
ncbi:mitochondrial 54S ribosomal protein bL28m [Saccharomyces paradoxus]|uniref:Large ribosomal subunit protein bL28m n=1 Tax=Saccharomyces paradoxus TaxID=27291 RepID=A0A8B8UXK2_SACPA|nr:Mrpl24 [Saccharomyces paradoxus]QHS75463.1 Mrpl24 [Saccharomyces paradoxus]